MNDKNKDMDITSETYALASSATSAEITLTAGKNKQSVILYNNSSVDVFVTSGVAAATAAIPASATVPVRGIFAPPGTPVRYNLPYGHGKIAAISPSADSGKFLYVTVGIGE